MECKHLSSTQPDRNRNNPQPSGPNRRTISQQERTVVHPRPNLDDLMPYQVPPTVQQREGFTAAIQNMFAEATHEKQLNITLEHLMLALMLALIFAIRISNLNFNTLHLDEAIYVSVGRDALSGNFSQGASGWMFGSYLYPVLAAFTYNLGGVVALRALSAVFMTVASVFVFLTARSLFDERVGLWALLIFGLSGISINLGQHAVYDVIGVAFLTITLYCAVRAAQNPNESLLAWVGIALSVSILGKYIGLLALPGIFMVMVLVHLWQGRGILSFARIPWLALIVPMLLILGIYAALYRQDLGAVFSGQYASQQQDRASILNEIVSEIGLVTLFALLGILMLAGRAARQLPNQPRLAWLLRLALPVLAVTILAMPIYHLATSNVRSLWKHDVYALVFLAPFAAYGVNALFQAFTGLSGKRARALRWVSAAITALGVFWFVTSAIQQNAIFHSSWPNTTNVVDYLKTQNLTPSSHILSPSYSIYEDVFSFGSHNTRSAWSNVWYEEYQGLTGTEAVTKAIQDCHYDVAVMDNYYAPEWAGTLEVLLQNAGYAVAYSTVEQLSSGAYIVTNVYKPGANAACRKGA
jgi:hypothetical protein